MQTKNKPSSRTTQFSAAAMTAALVLLATSFSARASAIDLQQRHRFEIPSEGLNAALRAFAAQSRIHVLASGVPAGVLSSEVRADLSPLEALSALLRGTGLAFRQVDAENLVVQPAAMAQLRPTQFLVGGTDANALADQPRAAAPAGGAPAQELTEVQVTGTRIIRQGYEAPTPVTAIGIQQLQDTANSNIGDTLVTLPEFQGSTTNQTSSNNNNNGFQEELNLRNLTAGRTLILFDGRRLPAGNNEAVPDIDLIPDALIQRVDVVTGGASATYGSDAVAGVVNYVLDTNFTGIKGLVQGGTTRYADGLNDKIQLTVGTTFLDGRLHLIASADQSYQSEIPGYTRAWNVTGEFAITNPAYTTGSSVPNYIMAPCCATNPGYLPGGLILSGALQGTDFGAGNAVGQYNYGVGGHSAGVGDYGGDYQLVGAAGQDDLLNSVDAQHYFVRVAFDLTPSTSVYAEFLNGLDHSVERCCPNYYPSSIGTIYTNNPYLAQYPTVVAAAAANNVTSFSFGKTIYEPPGAPGGISANTDSGAGLAGTNGVLGWGVIGGVDDRADDVYVLGFKGELKIGKNAYNWNLYGQQGVSEYTTWANGSIKTNLSDAIEAVTVGTYGGTTAYSSAPAPGGVVVTNTATYNAANFPNPLAIPNGTITCASNLLPRAVNGATSNCAPFDVFGIANETTASLAYTQGYATLRQVLNQSVVGGDISGEPFSTWAGPVSIDVDAEYRHEGIEGNGDANSQDLNWFSANYFATDASNDVKEGAVETVIPVLKDLPFAQELDLNGAARATDYKYSGFVTTYKYGFEYTPIPDVRIRAVRSEDIRAPTLVNLFGFSSGHSTSLDPFTNTQVPTTSNTQGNPNLRAEKAHQYEIGVVFQPRAIPGFNLSIDYYHLKLDGAISTLSTLFELDECLATQIPGTLTGTSPFCKLITRLSNGTLNSVTDITFNIASFLVSGVDYQMDYRKALTELVPAWKGAIDLHFVAANSQHDITNTGVASPTEVLEGAGVSGVPHWSVQGSLIYELAPVRITLTENYYSSVLVSNTYIWCSIHCPAPIPSGFNTVNWDPRIPTYFLTSLAVNYAILQRDQEELDAFVSIHNLLNRAPPPALTDSFYSFTPNTPTAGGHYDTVGTMIHAGVRFRF